MPKMTKPGKHIRLGCKRCGKAKLPGMGEMFCKICKPIAAIERKQKANIKYKRKTYVPKPRLQKVKVEKPKPNKVPTDVRDAWRRAHPNSILRKKFPTPQSLQKHNWEDKAA